MNDFGSNVELNFKEFNSGGLLCSAFELGNHLNIWLKTRKTKESYIEIDGHRTFRIQTDFFAAVRQKAEQERLPNFSLYLPLFWRNILGAFSGSVKLKKLRDTTFHKDTLVVFRLRTKYTARQTDSVRERIAEHNKWPYGGEPAETMKRFASEELNNLYTSPIK
jgi:hypothetical protein